MYEIIYMKSFAEPWWMLEGWEQDIIKRKKFATLELAEQYKGDLGNKLRIQYPEHRKKGEEFDVYWKKGDFEYCSDCDEDLQVYHGVIRKKE